MRHKNAVLLQGDIVDDNNKSMTVRKIIDEGVIFEFDGGSSQLFSFEETEKLLQI